MSARPRIRSTTDGSAKAPLSEAAILDAALAVTQAEGLQAVTTRRIASELETGPASLYVYVNNRDELLRLMLDRVVGTIPLVVPDPLRWREQLYDLLQGLREALEVYPGLASVLLWEPQATENV